MQLIKIGNIGENIPSFEISNSLFTENTRRVEKIRYVVNKGETVVGFFTEYNNAYISVYVDGVMDSCNHMSHMAEYSVPPNKKIVKINAEGCRFIDFKIKAKDNSTQGCQDIFLLVKK